MWSNGCCVESGDQLVRKGGGRLQRFRHIRALFPQCQVAPHRLPKEVLRNPYGLPKTSPDTVTIPNGTPPPPKPPPPLGYLQDFTKTSASINNTIMSNFMPHVFFTVKMWLEKTWWAWKRIPQGKSLQCSGLWSYLKKLPGCICCLRLKNRMIMDTRKYDLKPVLWSRSCKEL